MGTPIIAAMPSPHSRFLLILSYIIDWIVIIGIAAVGAAFAQKTANRRPFSPFDPSISFPYVKREKVSTAVLVVVSIIIPAVLTAAGALIFTPGSSRVNASLRGKGRRGAALLRRCWEWNVAWLGLGLALALTFMFTNGLKDIMGKPRPDLLARCNLDPDLLLQQSTDIVGGGFAQGILLSWTACRQTDRTLLSDGFQSFPSGHSSFSWCGMFYLTLYLCSKFCISIPYLLPTFTPAATTITAASSPSTHIDNDLASSERQQVQEQKQSRIFYNQHTQAAAPPAYLFVLPLVPVCVATYIASSRYSDFRHHGFDIIFGSLMGAFFAWVGFRMYHLPIQRGAGWAWRPRSATRAWGGGRGQGYISRPTAAAAADDSEFGGDVEMGALRDLDSSEGKVMNGDGAVESEVGQRSDVRPTAGSALRREHVT